MSIATAWLELAKQERAAHRRKWGTLAQQDAKPKPKPKQAGRPLGTYKPERLALIAEMVREGFRTCDIAEELEISESSVRYWRAKYELK